MIKSALRKAIASGDKLSTVATRRKVLREELKAASDADN